MEESISVTGKIRSYFQECWRVLKVTKKPNMLEFKTVVKVSALGMAIIGAIGFIIFLVKELLIG